jgi:hypothetical protein
MGKGLKKFAVRGFLEFGAFGFARKTSAGAAGESFSA